MDAELSRIEIDYDDLKLLVREESGATKRVTCEGYLGYELSGFWDEVIVASAAVTEGGSFLDRCLSGIARRVGATPLPSGSEARNRERAMQLVVTLSDGCQLHVAMKGLRVEDEGDDDDDGKDRPKNRPQG
jgi:hypothetical protein